MCQKVKVVFQSAYKMPRFKFFAVFRWQQDEIGKKAWEETKGKRWKANIREGSNEGNTGIILELSLEVRWVDSWQSAYKIPISLPNAIFWSDKVAQCFETHEESILSFWDLVVQNS